MSTGPWRPLPLSQQHLLDLSDIVAKTKISARSWRRIIRSGQIGILRIEGSVRIPEAELERYLSTRFTPAVKVLRQVSSETVKSLVDNAVARRGRPKISGRGTAS